MIYVFFYSNDFSKAVADEYLRYFNFERDTLDVALRKFLAQFSLTGETQERERVLVHFSKRYLDCNPGSFNSQGWHHLFNLLLPIINLLIDSIYFHIQLYIVIFRCRTHVNLRYNVT